MVKYPNRLRALREARGLTQEQVGTLVGITESAINRHERGNRSLDGNAIDRYARFYSVSAYELFVGANEVPEDIDTTDPLARYVVVNDPVTA